MAVAEEVPVPAFTPAPPLDAEGEGELIREGVWSTPPEGVAALPRLPVGDPEWVGERDRVVDPLGDLVKEGLPLPLLHPRPVGEVVEEVEGEEEVEGDAWVGW